MKRLWRRLFGWSRRTTPPTPEQRLGFESVLEEDTPELVAAWNACESGEGHVYVNQIDGFFCVKCWTGFFMGMAFIVGDEFRQDLETGKRVIWMHAKFDSLQVSLSEFYPQPDPDRTFYTVEQARQKGRRSPGYTRGGPPFVFEVR